ncbi:hypothetical protein Nepgr_031404 [Nepenthes gracilis]|uniref:Uncharacterized protein n=1 Tax=Nepenthes gracilis TaxID=150966 RepID=A0AAD3TI20_NEPGR|nr:hypothetical protein Nepgr_031404 [Nepenthes gracilis]
MSTALIDPLLVARVVGEVIDIFAPTVKMNVTCSLSNKHVCNGHLTLPSVIADKTPVGVGDHDSRAAYELYDIFAIVSRLDLY